jgi:O-antigen biosynthesis protein WbqP
LVRARAFRRKSSWSLRAARAALYEIRPGVTGISQVAGVDMSDPERLAELDARYLEQMSLGTDIRLILATALGAGRGDRVQN